MSLWSLYHPFYPDIYKFSHICFWFTALILMVSHPLWSIMPGKIRYLIYFYYFTFNNLWHFLFIFDRWKQSLTSYCVHHRSPPCSQLDRNTASLSKSISCSFSSIQGRRNRDGGVGAVFMIAQTPPSPPTRSLTEKQAKPAP